MFLWLVFGSIFGVWNVFQSSRPRLSASSRSARCCRSLIDAPFGEQSYAHTLLSVVVLLTVAMLATIGRGHRLRRRRALSLAIGWFAGLVLERRVGAQGSVLVARVRVRRPGRAAPPAAGPLVVVLELLGSRPRRGSGSVRPRRPGAATTLLRTGRSASSVRGSDG